MIISRFYKHLKSLYIACYGENAEQKVDFRIKIAAIIFIICLIAFSKHFFIGYAVFIASFPLIFMYVFLRVKVYVKQIDGSYEGIFYISELLNQYKINHQNMSEALVQSINCLDNCPYSRIQTYRMAMKLKVYTDEDDIRNIVDVFAKSINTNWATLLSNSVFLSIVYEQDVTHGLEDILIELRKAQIVYEKSYQNTSEGFIIVKYILPLIYVGSVYIGIHYFGLSFMKYLQYQFLTPIGLKMVITNSILFGANVIMMMMFKRRKFDI